MVFTKLVIMLPFKTIVPGVVGRILEVIIPKKVTSSSSDHKSFLFIYLLFFKEIHQYLIAGRPKVQQQVLPQEFCLLSTG